MKNIMLIDDDPTMRLLLKTLLNMEGFATSEWDGAKSIYDQIKNVRPDIVLLDVNLRGVNGIEALKEIRQDPALNQVRVIVSSGIDYTETAKKEGADEFLLKPYMPNDLINLLHEKSEEV